MSFLHYIALLPFELSDVIGAIIVFAFCCRFGIGNVRRVHGRFFFVSLRHPLPPCAGRARLGFARHGSPDAVPEVDKYATDGTCKILVGNKCDAQEERQVRWLVDSSERNDPRFRLAIYN